VSAPDFGQLFDTAINGEVHAQPLVANGRLLIVTEANEVYSLDPVSGAVLAHRTLHVPWSPSGYADQGLNCIPLQPSIGVMGTPAIDTDSNTAYFVPDVRLGQLWAAAFWAHAVDLQPRGASGFPVLIGNADNSGLAFDATYHVQRPASCCSAGWSTQLRRRVRRTVEGLVHRDLVCGGYHRSLGEPPGNGARSGDHGSPDGG
jgi:hypothetical protein